MTPEEYELFVKKDLEDRLRSQFGYHIPIRHQHKMVSPDGSEHNIDLSYEFILGGIRYVNIVECKYWNKPITREAVMALKARRDDLRAQKAIMVSYTGYQSGAHDFAKNHGIGLIRLTEAESEDWHYFDGGIGRAREIILASPDPEVGYTGNNPALIGIFYPSDKDYSAHLINAFGEPLLAYMSEINKGNIDLDNLNLVVPPEIVEAVRKVSPNWDRNCKLIESAGLGFNLDTDEMDRLFSFQLLIIKTLIERNIR